MRYMLVNVAPASLQVELYDPEQVKANSNMRRIGPIVAISLDKGTSVDILPYFNGSLEKAHSAVKYSRDTLRLLSPDRLCINVCDDQGNKVDIDKIFSVVESRKPVVVPAVTVTQTVAEVNTVIDKNTDNTKKYTKYTKEQLMEMKRDDLIKLGSKKFGLKFGKKDNKEVIINVILEAQ